MRGVEKYIDYCIKFCLNLYCSVVILFSSREPIFKVLLLMRDWSQKVSTHWAQCWWTIEGSESSASLSFLVKLMR